jgi:hypothetical protein
MVDVVLPHLLNDLAALESEIALVIDDYHLVTNTGIHEALAYLIGSLPPAVRIVLATRADPPLPLGRMRARAELAELRVEDLRFTREETTTFLTAGLGIELTAGDVDRLHARTEGWPAALYLAALWLRSSGDPGTVIDRFAGDDRYLVDYLTTEVLASQRPEVRAFLLRTSILDRLCAPLCDAVTGCEDSAALLAEIERSNLLLVPLDARREWYRYHHLFADLLRHELAGEEPGAAAVLHRRAHAWYRDAGLIVDAAAHATAADDVDAAMQLVARHYAMFVGQGQLATVIRWIDALPQAAAAGDWLVCFAASIVMAHAGADRRRRALAGPRQGRPGGRAGRAGSGLLARSADRVPAAPARRRRRRDRQRSPRARRRAERGCGGGAHRAARPDVGPVVVALHRRGEDAAREREADGAGRRRSGHDDPVARHACRDRARRAGRRRGRSGVA